MDTETASAQLDSVLTFARRLPDGTDQLGWIRRGYGPRHLRRAARKATHRTRHAAAWLARHTPATAEICCLPSGLGCYTLY